MPLATSPYQQNDYTSISSRTPHRLNIQAVAQTAMALDLFWKKGAERVKSAYDSALNLSLTSDENNEVKKKFLEEARQQLTQLSAQDLSNPKVQRQGIGIFKPIFEDKAIMQDDHLTKLRQSIFAEAEQYKRDPKTKGAGFHMDNLAYALQGFQGFNSKTPRNQIGDVYENAKDSQYIPHYDDSKERMAILKECKANTLSSMTASGQYIETYSDKSLYQSKLYGCLDGALSDQARQQNRISAAVRYGHDYQAVKEDYMEAAKEKTEYYELQKQKMIAKREALTGVAGNEEQLAELKGQIDLLDGEIEKTKKQESEYASMGSQYIKDNYEDMAATAYFRRRNGAFAAAFATTDIQTKLKENAVYITEYVQNELNKRQDRQITATADLENQKFRNKLLLGVDDEGKSTKTDILTRFKTCWNDNECKKNIGQFLTEAYNEPATTSNKMRVEINNLIGQKDSLIKDMQNDPDIQKIIGDITPGDIFNPDQEGYRKMLTTINEFVANASDSDPRKQRIIEASNRLVELDNRRTMLRSIIDDAETQVGVSNPEIQKKYNEKKTQVLSSAKPEKLFDGTTIDAQRAANIMAGTDPELSIVPYTSTQSGPGMTPSTTLYEVIRKDGKQVGWFNANKGNIESLNVLNSSREGSYNALLDKYLGENTVVQKMGLSTGDLFTKGSPAQGYLNDIFGSNLGIIGESTAGGGVVFNSMGGLDPVTGRVIVQATDKDGPISFKRLRDAAAKSPLAQSFYGEEVPNNPNAMLMTIPQAVGLVQQPLYGESIRQLLNYGEKRIGSLPNTGVVYRVGQDRTGQSYSIRLKKKIGTNAPEYTVLATSPQGKTQEMPLLNRNQLDPKENALTQLDKLLNGYLTKPQED